MQPPHRTSINPMVVLTCGNISTTNAFQNDPPGNSSCNSPAWQLVHTAGPNSTSASVNNTCTIVNSRYEMKIELITNK